MPTLKGTEVSLSYAQSFVYLVSSSINVSIFHITWSDTFWTDLIFLAVDSYPDYYKPPINKKKDWQHFMDKTLA